MTSLKESLPRYLHTSRLTLELFDSSTAHYDRLLAVLNTATAHSEMKDYGIRTTAQLDSLAHVTRLSPSACGEKLVDMDIYYLLRVDGPLMGGITLAQRQPDITPDLGWCIMEEYMGQGYAAEAGKEVLRYFTEDFGISEIMAWPTMTNKRSHRVAEKIGFVEARLVND